MRHKPIHRPPGTGARPLVEVCVQTITSAVAAERAGADRIELCAALAEGGLTPGPGLLRAVRVRVGIPIHVMIRPRAGDFVYDDAELEAMLGDIREARRAGAEGVVFGALTAAGGVDREQTARLVSAARPLAVTFHRAVDQTPDLEVAIGALVTLGVDRVLTSGGAPAAESGEAMLASLEREFGSRIVILAGGGIRAKNVAGLVRQTGIREVHLGPCRGPRGELDVAELEAVITALEAERQLAG